jgi:DnaD/phage-associated family protein
MGEQQSYYAVIPANVRYDDELSANAKLLYGEITCLCNKEGYCWATNGYFAKLYNVSKVTVSRWITQLKEKGYIHLDFKTKDETTMEQVRIMSIVNTPYQKCYGGHNKNDKPPLNKNVKDNNTSMNNTRVSKLSPVNNEQTDELQPLIDFCQSNVEILTPFKLQMLEGYVTDFGIEWVQKGLEKLAGLDRSKQNMKYLGGVLDGWQKDGVPKPWENKKPAAEEQISGAEFMRREEERHRQQVERDMRLAAIARQQEEQMRQAMRC